MYIRSLTNPTLLQSTSKVSFKQPHGLHYTNVSDTSSSETYYIMFRLVILFTLVPLGLNPTKTLCNQFQLCKQWQPFQMECPYRENGSVTLQFAYLNSYCIMHGLFYSSICFIDEIEDSVMSSVAFQPQIPISYPY